MRFFVRNRSEIISTIKNLFILIYILMIFEGVFRKWVFPSLSSLIFFIKDPFVLLIYFYTFYARLFYICTAFYLYIIVSFLIIVQCMIYMLINPEGLVIYLYGLRNYLFYIPLIFVAASCITLEDVVRIAKLTMKIAIPISVLVFFQYTSAPEAYINKGLSDEGFVFMVADGIVRPYGLFTFTMGHVLFVGSIFSFSVALYFKAFNLGSMWVSENILLSIYMASMVFMYFTTGSRSIYAYSFLTLALPAFFNLIYPNYFITKNLIYFALLSMVIIVVFSFTDTYQIIVNRNISAVESEGSPIIRAFMSLFSFLEVINIAPIFGHGVGSGTNAAAALLRKGPSEQGMGFLLAEDEWSRIILELGLMLGGAYIMFRIYLVYWMFRLSLYSYKCGNIIPVLLFGFVGSIVLNGAMTMQGTVLAYGVLFSSLVVGSAMSTLSIRATTHRV